MQLTTARLFTTVFALSLFATVSVAQTSSIDHGAMEHSTMHHDGATETHHTKAMEQASDEVMGAGVIHRISKLNRMVNLTHEPIPALDWPEMTMDLPVADTVDLAALKPGDQVKFHLKLGADKKYLITRIMK